LPVQFRYIERLKMEETWDCILGFLQIFVDTLAALTSRPYARALPV
jgi:hypothetical protein